MTRAEAWDQMARLVVRLEDELRWTKKRLARVEELEQVTQRERDRARGELARLEANSGEMRQRVLRVQALRARLAKTSMSPPARLRTLKAAVAAGIELSGDQEDELWELDVDDVDT